MFINLYTDKYKCNTKFHEKVFFTKYNSEKIQKLFDSDYNILSIKLQPYKNSSVMNIFLITKMKPWKSNINIFLKKLSPYQILKW